MALYHFSSVDDWKTTFNLMPYSDDVGDGFCGNDGVDGDMGMMDTGSRVLHTVSMYRLYGNGRMNMPVSIQMMR